MLGARILVFLGALFLIASLLAGYIRFQALDTGTVKESATLLIEDKEIRDQIAATLVDQLFTNVDVSAQLEQQLPADQKALAGALSAAVRELADRGAVRMFDRPEAQQLWVNSIAFSHEQLITVLEDDVRGVETDRGPCSSTSARSWSSSGTESRSWPGLPTSSPKTVRGSRSWTRTSSRTPRI